MNNSRVSENLNYLNERFKDSQAFSDSTVAGEYLNWLADQIRENDENQLYRDRYKPIIEANRANKGQVFASVIMRTQGRRPEAIREALLCLYAQSEQDFEILLIGHKLNEVGRDVVEQVLEEQEPEFRKKIRYFHLDYGTRTTPLNYGFAQAYGEYIMILDDDDLVFEDWIRDFKVMAEKNPNTLLHCYVVGQQWEVNKDDQGNSILRASRAPDQKYSVDFDLISELRENVCPPVGLAFPSVAFHEWGIIFDETLDTTEDWDYMMRVVFLSGVSDVQKVNALYRLWTNAESSATVHSLDVWKKNYGIIRNKFRKVPLVLRQGKALNIGLDSMEHSVTQNTHVAMRVMDDKLYYGNDKNWSEERSMVLQESQTIGSFEMGYTGLTGKHTHNQLRWDPASYGNFFIRNLGASISDKNGHTYYFKSKDIHSTGDAYHNGILFLKDDPQVYFDIPNGFKVEKFSVWGESMLNMPIWENRKALRIFVFIKGILQKLHIIS